MTDIDDALAALKADGFNHDDALRALVALRLTPWPSTHLDVLSVSGFLITRPQTLLDQLANAALETRP